MWFSYALLVSLSCPQMFFIATPQVISVVSIAILAFPVFILVLFQRNLQLTFLRDRTIV